MTTKIIQSTTLRNNMADTLDEVESNREIMLIARNDKPRVAMVNLDLLEELLELSDADYVESIRQARKDVKAGRLYSFEEVFGKV